MGSVAATSAPACGLASVALGASTSSATVACRLVGSAYDADFPSLAFHTFVPYLVRPFDVGRT